jgi:hypothetical protein
LSFFLTHHVENAWLVSQGGTVAENVEMEFLSHVREWRVHAGREEEVALRTN